MLFPKPGMYLCMQVTYESFWLVIRNDRHPVPLTKIFRFGDSVSSVYPRNRPARYHSTNTTIRERRTISSHPMVIRILRTLHVGFHFARGGTDLPRFILPVLLVGSKFYFLVHSPTTCRLSELLAARFITRGV